MMRGSGPPTWPSRAFAIVLGPPHCVSSVGQQIEAPHECAQGDPSRIAPSRLSGQVERLRRSRSPFRGRGRGWQIGQLYADRFMNGSRRTGAPHRGHGSPSRPYTASDRPKYPLSPLTFTYRLSNEVPPAASASARTSRTSFDSLYVNVNGESGYF